jgi:hypothetical protein
MTHHSKFNPSEHTHRSSRVGKKISTYQTHCSLKPLKHVLLTLYMFTNTVTSAVVAPRKSTSIFHFKSNPMCNVVQYCIKKYLGMLPVLF